MIAQMTNPGGGQPWAIVLYGGIGAAGFFGFWRMSWRDKRRGRKR